MCHLQLLCKMSKLCVHHCNRCLLPATDPSGHPSHGGPPRPTGSAQAVELFDLDAYADKQFYKHCHTAVGIIAQLLASEPFVAQVRRMWRVCDAFWNVTW